ncbi:XRE family transcriptional regulator [Streptomyces sp. NPDC001787]|uniref:MmyB family transcriptional regulator n=1 Tax=Streptomyces sp. NPDC001787 TaxID=3154523 RepID=UPI00332D97C2
MPKRGSKSAHLIAALLEPKRAAIRAEDHGLPSPRSGKPGPKTKGLTQVDIDTLTNRAERTYNRLVHGLLANPKEAYLAAVAEILQLSVDEYTLLCIYALGHKPVQQLEPVIDLAARDLWQAACDGQREMMYVTDLAWNLLVHNQPFADLFVGGLAPRNTARWMLLADEARTTLVDWESTWAPAVSAQVQAALAEHPINDVLRRLEDDVRADPQAGPIYSGCTEASIAPDGAVRRMLHPLRGPGTARMVAASPYASPGARMIIVMFESQTSPQLSSGPG